jgi:hypothetical protein
MRALNRDFKARFDDYRALRRRLDPKGKLLNAHLGRIFGD